MTTPTQNSDLERLHGERRKVLRPVDGDRGKLSFEVSPDREGNGADLVLWEKRGTRTWGVPIHHLTYQQDAQAVSKELNGLVKSGILCPGPLLPTNDSISDAPSFSVTRGGALGGFGVKLVSAKRGQAWGAFLTYIRDKEEAQALSETLNHLLESKVIRSAEKFIFAFASEEGRNQRIRHWDGIDETMARLADNNHGTVRILQEVAEAAPKVDPNTKILNPGPLDSLDPRQLPLKALDNAGIYGKDIEGVFQICGRHPGKMVAVLRATELGLIDAPAIKAALEPIGILRAGGLDVDGIVRAVESAVPEFSASRVSPPPLTGMETPHVSADIQRISREAQDHRKSHDQERK